MINIMEVNKIKLCTRDYTIRGDGSMRRGNPVTAYVDFSAPAHRGKYDNERARLKKLSIMLKLMPRQHLDGRVRLQQNQVPTSIFNLMIHVDGKLTSYRDIPISNLQRTQLDNLPRFDYSGFEYSPRTLAN